MGSFHGFFPIRVTRKAQECFSRYLEEPKSALKGPFKANGLEGLAVRMLFGIQVL